MPTERIEGGLTPQSVKHLNDILTKLPSLIDRERALLAAKKKAGKVFERVTAKYVSVPGFFKNVDTHDKPQAGRGFINRLNETIGQVVVRGTGAPGVRVGLRERKGRYVSYHANFLEGGTIQRTRASGGDTGKIKAHYTQEKIWKEGTPPAVRVLESQLPLIVERIYKKKYKGKQ